MSMSMFSSCTEYEPGYRVKLTKQPVGFRKVRRVPPRRLKKVEYYSRPTGRSSSIVDALLAPDRGSVSKSLSLLAVGLTGIAGLELAPLFLGDRAESFLS